MVPVAFAGFANARTLSSAYTETPEAASRSFDDERDGFVMGESGAILMLESLSHAVAHGADSSKTIQLIFLSQQINQ